MWSPLFCNVCPQQVLCFASLQEGDGTTLQAMLSLAEVGEEALAEWKVDADLGDRVIITGRVISSRRGELSVMANKWQMASRRPCVHCQWSFAEFVRGHPRSPPTPT